MARFKWLAGGLICLLLTAGCAGLTGTLYPSTTSPDSPGGEKVTKEEVRKASDHASKTSEQAGGALAGILSMLGLPGLAAVAGAGGSIVGNVIQWTRGRKYKKAAQVVMKAVDAAKDKNPQNVREALEEAGATEGEASEIYHYFKQKGMI